MNFILQAGLSLDSKITSTHSLTLTPYFSHLRTTTASCSLFISLSLSHTHTYFLSRTHTNALTQSLTHTNKISITQKFNTTSWHLTICTSSTQLSNAGDVAELAETRSIASRSSKALSPLCVRIKTKSGNSIKNYSILMSPVQDQHPHRSTHFIIIFFLSPSLQSKHLLYVEQASNRKVGVL